ncbi:MAG: hypothetical protein WBL35_02515 [Ornithinibacter sp.]
MLQPVMADVAITPLLTVGETLPNGYRFSAIPDGIALAKRNGHRVDAYVNHETSRVPFPITGDPATTLNDFDNSQLSQLTIDLKSTTVLEGRDAIPSSANYQRFCSNYYVSHEQGFNRPMVLTGEEATDSVNRTGDAYPAGPEAEQAGVSVAYDVKSGDYRTIYGMGRLNHENEVALSGYDGIAVLTGDDTFSAPSSQLYMYTARNASQLWADDGQLWALVSDDAAVNDYGDLAAGDSVSGHFIPVPDDVAKGPQTPLETWSNDNNVFQFIRVEDIATDKTSPNVVYFADTGEPRAVPDPSTGRLRRAPSGTEGEYMNGRIFRMELDPVDPSVVLSLSVLVDADAGGYGNPGVLHQPDNVETTPNGVLIQEDPGSHNGGTGFSNARVWWFDFANESMTVVAEVDQSADPTAKPGNWESTGIVDASASFGPGSFLVNVQAHSIITETLQEADWLDKREGGQMLLMTIPGTS